LPKSTKRANENDLNALHRLTVKGVVAELRRLRRAKETIPPGLLQASIKLLAVTGSTTPDRPARRPDRLAGLLEEFNEDEAYAAAEGRPATGKGSRGPREVDFSLPTDEPPAREFPDEG
jgi:hypothetical protein